MEANMFIKCSQLSINVRQNKHTEKVLYLSSLCMCVLTLYRPTSVLMASSIYEVTLTVFWLPPNDRYHDRSVPLWLTFLAVRMTGVLLLDKWLKSAIWKSAKHFGDIVLIVNCTHTFYDSVCITLIWYY